MSQEVLEAGTERPRRGVPAWLVWTLGIGALVIITLANALALTELTTRTIESEALVSSVEASESAMKATQDAFTAVMDKYDTQSLTDAEREELRAELAQVAQEGQAAIALAGVGVADVSILPWHTSVLDAQQAYLAHNEAWVAYLGAAAQDPAEWFRPQQAVNDTFAAARDPLVAAVPLFDLMETVARIELIFASGTDGGGDGQSA